MAPKKKPPRRRRRAAPKRRIHRTVIRIPAEWMPLVWEAARAELCSANVWIAKAVEQRLRQEGRLNDGAPPPPRRRRPPPPGDTPPTEEKGTPEG